jgi:hypothetical protein
VAIIVGYIFWRTKHTIPPLFGTMNRLWFFRDFYFTK